MGVPMFCASEYKLKHLNMKQEEWLSMETSWFILDVSQ